jgi:hypothetical protein
MKTFLTVLFLAVSAMSYAIDYAYEPAGGRLVVVLNGRSPFPPAFVILPESLRAQLRAGLINAGDVIIDNGSVRLKTRAERLQQLKTEKRTAVQDKSTLLLNSGITFDSNRFSIARHVQTYWVGISTLDAKGLIPWPFGVTTLDDTVYVFANSDSYTMFLGSVLTRIKYIEDGEQELLLAIDNAETLEAFDAVVDERE